MCLACSDHLWKKQASAVELFLQKGTRPGVAMFVDVGDNRRVVRSNQNVGLTKDMEGQETEADSSRL